MRQSPSFSSPNSPSPSSLSQIAAEMVLFPVPAPASSRVVHPLFDSIKHPFGPPLQSVVLFLTLNLNLKRAADQRGLAELALESKTT